MTHMCQLCRLFANLRESNSMTNVTVFVFSVQALACQARSRRVAKSHDVVAKGGCHFSRT